MSPFHDDDEFEIARRLRRAAGPTPDVYVAYETVLDHVGAVRRRRRLAVSSASAVAIVAMGGMYVLDLQDDGRTVRFTAPTSVVEESTTTRLDLDVRPTVVVVTTTAPTTTTSAVAATTVAATSTAVETTAPETTALAPPPTLAPAPTAPPTTAKRRPPSTPPATQPPAPAAPVETAPPETPPSTEVPPTAAPDTTVPPTAPETTAPAVTAPPLATTPAQPVPDSTTPVSPEPFTDAYGNSGVASYGGGRLQFGQVRPASGWEAQQTPNASDVRAVIRFAPADGSAPSVITAVLDGSRIRIS